MPVTVTRVPFTHSLILGLDGTIGFNGTPRLLPLLRAEATCCLTEANGDLGRYQWAKGDTWARAQKVHPVTPANLLHEDLGPLG